MNKTTDIRSITCPDIALDPVKGGPRLIAQVQTIFPDGVMLLKFVNRSGKGYYKDGVLETPSSCGPINCGRHVITWQGELPSRDPWHADDGLAAVAQDIADGQSRIVDMDDVKVPVRRAALCALLDALSLNGHLPAETARVLEEVRRAAA